MNLRCGACGSAGLAAVRAVRLPLAAHMVQPAMTPSAGLRSDARGATAALSSPHRYIRQGSATAAHTRAGAVVAGQRSCGRPKLQRAERHDAARRASVVVLQEPCERLGESGWQLSGAGGEARKGGSLPWQRIGGSGLRDGRSHRRRALQLVRRRPSGRHRCPGPLGRVRKDRHGDGTARRAAATRATALRPTCPGRERGRSSRATDFVALPTFAATASATGGAARDGRDTAGRGRSLRGACRESRPCSTFAAPSRLSATIASARRGPSHGVESPR